MAKTVQIFARVSPRVVERAEKLKCFISDEQGREATLADVYRQALAIGLTVLTRRQRDRSGVDTSDHDDEEDRELVDEAVTA